MTQITPQPYEKSSLPTGDQGDDPQKDVLSNLSPFLRKLWMMVNQGNGEGAIGWNSAGDGFVISDQVRFVMHLLPVYFKHNNMASFVRQLNFYGFHKVGETFKGRTEFAHPYFLKDLPETLAFIIRKQTGSPGSRRSTDRMEHVSAMLDDVKRLKSKHHLVESELQKLRRENSSLWDEINSLRYKHTKQAKIIYKLIHFLVSYMHSERERKPAKASLHASPKLLEIDYRGRKRDEIESLLEESSRDSQQESYTVSYSPGPKPTGSIEELSDTEQPEPEEEPYIVRFPETGKETRTEPVEPIEPVDEIDKLLGSEEPVGYEPGQFRLANLPEPASIDLIRNLLEPIHSSIAPEPVRADQVDVAKPPEPVQVSVPSYRIHHRATGDYEVLKDDRATGPVEKYQDGAKKRPVNRSTGSVDKSSKVARLVPETTGKSGGSSAAPPPPKPPKPRRKPSQPARLTRPSPPHHPGWTASEDPHSSLGSYLNSTDSKLDGLRDILEGIESEHLDNLTLIRRELENELARLPEDAQAQGNAAASLEALLGNGDD